MTRTVKSEYQGKLMAHYYQYLLYVEKGDSAKAALELENLIVQTDDTQWIEIAQQHLDILPE